MAKIAPSILSANFANLSKDFTIMENGNADYVHLDIMDGKYVPNLTFGPPVVSHLKPLTKIPFDVHLMVENPENYIEEFVNAGADIITFHSDATIHTNRVIQQIHSYGKLAGVAINPGQSLDCLEYTLHDLDLVLIMSVNPGFGGQSFIANSLDKIKALKTRISDLGLKTLIEVDGGIKLDNAKDVLNAGADILVAGSAIFNSDNPEIIMEEFKKIRGSN